MNSNKLRSVMVLYGDTNKTLADYLGISTAALSHKINENGSEFRQGEISQIAKRYELSAVQIKEFFFS